MMSANELAKGCTLPIHSRQFPDGIWAAQETLMAKPNLIELLRSKSTTNVPIRVGDMDQIYTKNKYEKRGRWSISKPVLSYDHESRTLTVPGSGGRKVGAAIEDVTALGPKDQLATAIQESIDAIDITLRDAADAATDISEEPRSEQAQLTFYPVFSDERNHLNDPNVGNAIEVWWPDDKQFYPKKVSDIPSTCHHEGDYDDGDQEILKLENENWRRLPVCNINTVSKYT